MNWSSALCADGSGSRIIAASPSRKKATPQPSICGPVSPPRRANSDSENFTVVGCRLEIANSSHIGRHRQIQGDIHFSQDITVTAIRLQNCRTVRNFASGPKQFGIVRWRNLREREGECRRMRTVAGGIKTAPPDRGRRRVFLFKLQLLPVLPVPLSERELCAELFWL